MWVLCHYRQEGAGSGALARTGNMKTLLISASEIVLFCLPTYGGVGIIEFLWGTAFTHLEDLVEGHVLMRLGLDFPS